ncbi:MAG TPA: ATP synthase F0 subunit C [Candidatus Angelobacter sp.]|jgi:F-type H+-transporting ATPase subunit c|nr:ATP synthase F0 subunit C [Candidatus Angelobacter sp.]
MRKTMMYVFLVMAILFLAMPVYAQGTDGGSSSNWGVPIAAGIGMGIASGLCGLGQGKATASAAEALARNPGARPGIQFVLILGLVLIESLAIYTLLVVFTKIK